MNDTTQSRAVAPIVQFKRDLARLKDDGELDMLPANVSFDAFRNAAVVAITDNPSILQCNKASLFKSIRRLAAAGLVPDGREAAIVPYNGAAQAMPMVYGLIKVARNSGEISSIWAEVVRGDEAFRISMVNGERRFEHEYDPLHRSGEVKGAYAVAKLKDGTIEVEAMGREDIEKRRRASANQKQPNPTGIWAQWYDEMAKKTVIRALVKRLPVSSEDMRRVMVEEDEPVLRDVTPEKPDYDNRTTLAQRIMGHTPAVSPEKAAPPAESAQDGDVRDGEVLPPEESDTAPTDAPDVSGAFPGSPEWDEGVEAFKAGKNVGHCPYDLAAEKEKATDWLGGWNGAKEEAAR